MASNRRRQTRRPSRRQDTDPIPGVLLVQVVVSGLLLALVHFGQQSSNPVYREANAMVGALLEQPATQVFAAKPEQISFPFDYAGRFFSGFISGQPGGGEEPPPAPQGEEEPPLAPQEMEPPLEETPEGEAQGTAEPLEGVAVPQKDAATPQGDTPEPPAAPKPEEDEAEATDETGAAANAPAHAENTKVPEDETHLVGGLGQRQSSAPIKGVSPGGGVLAPAVKGWPRLPLSPATLKGLPDGGLFFITDLWGKKPGEEKALKAPNNAILSPVRVSHPLTPPLAGEVTSSFGYRIHPTTQMLDFHTGVDVAAPMNTPIAAALPGVVEEVGSSPIYGNFITLRHGVNLTTRYCHCEEILVDEGVRLRQGERIALVGNTGISTGPHLHFEVLVDDLLVDPIWVLEGQTWA